MSEAAGQTPETKGGPTPTDPVPSAEQERILLLECRLEQLRSALAEARAEGDRVRASLAEASSREAGYARRHSLAQQELAEARAEIASLHERLGRSEALRAELEGHLFEAGAHGDAAELVRLRREVLAQRQRSLNSERTLARVRARMEELLLSREALLSRIAEWHRLVRKEGPEAVDLAEFIAELRRDILHLEQRNAAGERQEAELRERMVRAGLDPDAPPEEDPSFDPPDGPGAGDRERPAPAGTAHPAEPGRPAEQEVDSVTADRPAAAGPMEAGRPAEDEAMEAPAAEPTGSDATGEGEPVEGRSPWPDRPWQAELPPLDAESAGTELPETEADETGPPEAGDAEAGFTEEQAEEPAAPDAEAVTPEAEAHPPEAEPGTPDAEAVTPEAGPATSEVDAPTQGAEPVASEVEPAPSEEEPAVADAERSASAEPEGGRRRSEAPRGSGDGPSAGDASRDADGDPSERASSGSLEEPDRGEGDGLESPDPMARAEAYGRLARRLRGDPSGHVERLRPGLADPDPRVRRRAVLAAATAPGLTLHPLLEPLRDDPDPQVRRVVREVLRHAPPPDLAEDDGTAADEGRTRVPPTPMS